MFYWSIFKPDATGVPLPSAGFQGLGDGYEAETPCSSEVTFVGVISLPFVGCCFYSVGPE